MKTLHLLIFLIFPVVVLAQNTTEIPENIVVAKSDKSSFQVVADSLVNILPNKSIYLIGEIHSIKANDFIFYPLFKTLHKKRGVNYILKEMNHSLFFGYNLFLKYGDVRILAEFNKVLEKDSLKLRSSFTNTIALYEYNKLQDASQKIQFIGAEFDIENIPFGRPLTSHHYITAIRYLKKYSTQQLPETIDKIFQEIISVDANDVKLLTKKDKELNQLSALYRNELKLSFGDFYKDYYIIINSFKTFPTGRRDPGMVNNLENAYQIIKEMDPNAEPKFFGSFAAKHVIPGNNGSFASKMNSSSIIKGGLAFIGTSYFESTTNYAKTIRDVNESSLAGLSNKDEHLANTVLQKISIQQNAPIILLGRYSNMLNSELSFLKGFDAVFVFTGFR